MHPSQLDPQEVNKYRMEEREKVRECIDHYIDACNAEQVTAKVEILERDNVEQGIVESIFQQNIHRLVMGAAADNKHTRNMGMPTSKKALYVRSHAPTWCTVWFVCNGNLIYPPDTDAAQIRSLSAGEPRRSILSLSTWFGGGRGSGSLPKGRYNSAQSSSCSVTDGSHSPSFSIDINSITRTTSDTSSVSQGEDEDDDGEEEREGEDKEDDEREDEDRRPSGIYQCRVDSPQEDEVEELREVLRKYRLEARNLKKDAYEELVKRQEAEDHATNARKKARSAEKFKSEAEQKMQKMENLLKEMEGRITELENENAWLRDQVAEVSSNLEVKNKQLEVALSEREKARNENFLEFPFNELSDATRGFDSSAKIGEGGFGEVYKGELHCTPVAIKRLKSEGDQGMAQFQQEILALTKLRHPHLVTLMGVCSEARCLVYEHLSNGSLEDRLFINSNEEDKPRLWWKQRLTIAAEVCLGLLFLHRNAVVHSDVKPANILLDANLKAKISDFGICRFLPKPQRESTDTVCRLTDPKGSGMYMDPQFIMSGELTFKSDVYAFGVIILQLLTGKSGFGLPKEVENAMNSKSLNKIIDKDAGRWPSNEVIQIAEMGLKCCELNRKSRPDLEEVWQLLQRYISDT